MSNRDSLGFGDLLPQDVVEIFAQEKHSKRGLKKRSNSLGRALGWLKGKKKKDVGATGKSLGLGPALDLALDGHPAGLQSAHKGGQKSGKQAHQHGNSHAVLKQNDKTPAPPMLQENVFIETSRPKYLEDLHTEALEGLKMMQQEETNNGVEYQDNESTISNMTVQTDGEGGGFMTDSTTADTSSVVSVQSSVSTRSGLTRQASTFRPLNSGKKTKRRRHKKTLAGIPQHVQRELGLDRAGWTLSQKQDQEQPYNGDTDNSHTSDGPQKGTSTNPHYKNVIQPLNKDQVEQPDATHAGHRDETALLRHLGSDFSDGQSSVSQGPPSPVMSISPQAAYMSTIIRNAVLPPSIEVVEISRGRSHNSVRTVSKSSLLLSSPAPSRASSRASSSRNTSSKASTISSAYCHNPYSLSDSSCWSNSESSETLVSDSSTISSGSTLRQARSRDKDCSAKEDKVSVHASVSKASKCTSNGKLIGKAGEIRKEGHFVRSLSVTKPKKAPPPPSRSYSLHSKMKRRSRDLAEVKVIAGVPSVQPGSSPMHSRTIDSPDYNADTSSLDDTGSVSFSPTKSQLKELKTEYAETISKDASQEKQGVLQVNKLGKIISPSSGYSSQDATSPQFSKQPHSSSSRHKRGFLAKLQRFFPGSTPAGLAQPLVTQPAIPEKRKPIDSVDTLSVSTSVRTLRDLFDIPPYPKVHAPPPPPPEVWAHSKRTFELLLGPPAPDDVYAIIKKNPKDRRQRQSPSASTEGSVKSLVAERKHKSPTITMESVNGSLHVLQMKKVQESGIVNTEIHKEDNEKLVQNVDLKGNSEVAVKDEKVRVSDMLNGMILKAVEKREERLIAIREDVKKTAAQGTEVKTLPAISLAHISPSPSPLAAHHPPKLLTKQTAKVASVTSVQPVVSPDSSWPPPPSPMGQAGVGRSDQTDFALPPPPLFSEVVIPVQVPPERSLPVGGSSSTTTFVTSLKTECVKVTTAAEPQRSSSVQVITSPPLNIPPPPSYTAPPPPINPVSPPKTQKVFLPPEEVIPLPPPEEFCLPPPKEFSAPPPTEVSAVRPKESSLQVQEVPPLVKDITPTLIKVVSPPLFPHLVIKTSPLPPNEISTQSTEEVAPSFSQDSASQSSVEATVVSNLAPPQSIPPAPPLPSPPKVSRQDINLTQETIPSKSCVSILTPSRSIPAPLPIEFLHQPPVVPLNTDGPVTQEAPLSIPPVPAPETYSSDKAQEPPPPPTVNIPLPPPLPVQGLASIKHQPSHSSTEVQNQMLPSARVVQEELTPIVTPLLLQMVKLRAVNSSHEPPKTEKQPQAEVMMRKQKSCSQMATSSVSGEAPQKPIRKSLIMTCPTSTSPPVITTSQPDPPKSQSVVVPPASSSAALCPMSKSPPAMTATPSMNLQEAIRLRTAARSKERPASRLSLPSPPSPIDPHKSPSSTASFIFSKSNKRAMIETKRAPEAKPTVQQNQGVSFVTKVMSEAEKKGVKVPPPVATKPNTMVKENENGEEMEQTAGQEAEQEHIEGAAEKTNGTAGTVEGGETPST